MGCVRRIRHAIRKIGLCAALTAACLPATAADFSPTVLRRAQTQGLVSELFLYELTPQEINLLRQRMLQPTDGDPLSLSYEPTLADLVPAMPAAPSDKLLSMLRPVNPAQPGQTQDTVLIAFTGTTLHARRYRMATLPVGPVAASSNLPDDAQLLAQTLAVSKPDAYDDKKAAFEAASANLVSDVTVAVNRWVQAWALRDVAAYAAAYEPGFKGEGGAARSLSNAAWLAQRRERILSKRDIKVVLEDLQVSVRRGAPADAPSAYVRFVQRYRGDATVLVGRKRLGLVLRQGVWLIREEVSL